MFKESVWLIYFDNNKIEMKQNNEHLSFGSGAPSSMKLGNRPLIRQNTIIYYLECNNTTILEQYIHNYYGSRFRRWEQTKILNAWWDYEIRRES